MDHVLPVTLSVTKFTRTVQLNTRTVKVKLKSHRWFDRPSQRFVTRLSWSSDDMNLVGVTRLEIERAMLNENGWGLEFHMKSLEEWSL